MNLKAISEVLSAVKDYLFPYEKISKKFLKINNEDDLINFIKEKSAFVTQSTLYGYLKTRMGLKQNMMFTDDIFLGKRSYVWLQALNRVHVQKSILLYCFGILR